MIEGMKPGRISFLPLILMLLLIPVSSFTLIPAAGASDAAPKRWKAIAGKNGEERILYDPDSVIPSGPGTFRVRIMGSDADHFPRNSVEEFDCSNRIVRDVEVISEKPNRPATRTFTPSDWRGVVRESPRGELMEILCR